MVWIFSSSALKTHWYLTLSHLSPWTFGVLFSHTTYHTYFTLLNMPYTCAAHVPGQPYFSPFPKFSPVLSHWSPNYPTRCHGPSSSEWPCQTHVAGFLAGNDSSPELRVPRFAGKHMNQIRYKPFPWGADKDQGADVKKPTGRLRGQEDRSRQEPH